MDLPPPSGFTSGEQVLRFIAKKPASRSDIAQSLEISRTSLSRALDSVASFITIESEPGEDPDRPVDILKFDDSVAYMVGMDLARSTSSAVMLDRLGEPIVETSFPSSMFGTAEERTQELCERLMKQAEERGVSIDRICRVGLGIPMPVGKRQAVKMRARNQLFPIIHSFWDAPILIDNSVRFGALGEAYWGAGKGAPSQFYLRLSKSVGGCLLTDSHHALPGKLCEFGHISIPGETEKCNCGKLGCVETITTIQAICKNAEVANADELREALKNKDPKAREAVARAAKAVGWALGMVVFVSNPQLIICSGEVVEVIPGFLRKVEEELFAQLMPNYPHVFAVTSAQLVVGAALGAAFASDLHCSNNW
ncbi:MAG: ROK family transcriptional regulator [Actinomycetaceae bacterium]|nr:ROK family transcriptional regulator [Actinomycetaceae bacterium]